MRFNKRSSRAEEKSIKASRSDQSQSDLPAACESRRASFFAKLGPGLITGAADDDPSGIATYSQAGAQFGYGMLWTLVLTFPLMAAIQIVSAKLGRVTGHGLATNMRKHSPAWMLYGVVGLLLIANTINIAADVAAMGEALSLLIGGTALWYAVGFGLLSMLLQIFVPYKRYVRVLKWLTLSLLSYVAAAFIVHISWMDVLRETVWPEIEWQPQYITTLVAVLGTTISPYLFFWQASQEVEEMLDKSEPPLKSASRKAPDNATASFRRIKLDTLIGAGFSNLVAFFIMLTAAATLHQHGVTDIHSAVDAAEALRPIAGNFAFWIFAAGIVGTGLLAIPVLAGSAAYAIAGVFQFRNSLSDRPQSAMKFYAVVAFATMLGVAFCFMPIEPFKALYWSAVINGVLAVPILFVMMWMASSATVMGRFAVPGIEKFLGWAATVAMLFAVVAMLRFGQAG